MNGLEELIIAWNNKYPHDRKWRKKYNIPFLSNEHQNVNQIDVFFDAMEEKVFEKHRLLYNETESDLNEYKTTGNMFKKITENSKEFDKLFDKIDINAFNSEKEINLEENTNG